MRMTSPRLNEPRFIPYGCGLFIVGFIISLVIVVLIDINNIFLSLIVLLILTFVFAIIVGVFKELFEEHVHKQPDYNKIKRKEMEVDSKKEGRPFFKRRVDVFRYNLLNLKETTHWFYVIPVISPFIIGIIIITVSLLIDGLVVFLMTLITISILLIMNIMIYSVSKNKKFLIIIGMIMMITQFNLQSLSYETASYCHDPSFPFWDTDSWGDPPRTYNGIPFPLKFLYDKGYNPCDIPIEYIIEDSIIRDNYKETGRLFDWFK